MKERMGERHWGTLSYKPRLRACIDNFQVDDEYKHRICAFPTFRAHSYLLGEDVIFQNYYLMSENETGSHQTVTEWRKAFRIVDGEHF
jgi:hypothetical protein